MAMQRKSLRLYLNNINKNETDVEKKWKTSKTY